jgi:hypothetical protein
MNSEKPAVAETHTSSSRKLIKPAGKKHSSAIMSLQAWIIRPKERAQ